MIKTYSAKPAEVLRKWYVIDASEAPLGRIATTTAALLLGKGKPKFTRHIDCGDHVIIINAQNLVVSGNKQEKKIYYRHSNYPGGLTQKTLREKMEQDPTDVIRLAVRGMLPVNKLRQNRLLRLRIYRDADHGHEAQKPEIFSVKDKV